jgi:hypothetical protein
MSHPIRFCDLVRRLVVAKNSKLAMTLISYVEEYEACEAESLVLPASFIAELQNWALVQAGGKVANAMLREEPCML